MGKAAVYKIIKDSDIHHVWLNPKTGDTVTVKPDYYQENGIPVTEDGDELQYMHSMVKL